MAIRWLWLVLVIAATTGFEPRQAEAEGACPKAGTLGIFRTVEIDTTGGPGFGMEHYKAYDFLQPKEVVLTFDDGPQKYSTEAVLKALADECVKATFFSIGKMALGYPEIIREVAKAGHTIGTHTWDHKAIAKLKTFEEGKDEIERGVSAVHRAVGGPIAPFFRFPTLVDTPESVAYLGKRNIAMFSTDIDSFDFKPQTADHLVKSVMEKLDKRGKGILLMHDIHKTTAKAVPMLLAELKAKGYKIVHMTAKGAVTTVAEFDAAIEKEAKGLPQVGAERPTSSIVKTVEGTPPPAESKSSTGEPEGLPPAPQPEPAAAAATPPASANPTGATGSPAGAAPAASMTPGDQSSIATPKAEAEDADMAAAPAAVSAAPHEAAAAVTTPPPAPQAMTRSVAAAGPPETTSSVVRTVSGSGADARPAAAEPSAAGEAAHPQPAKSISERFKETWQLWFGQ
jgi:peptidoglycan/xylan/chitin deacetylase (PgdA/CDA1 family)